MIIAFTGLKQSGKSTGCKFLIAKYDFIKHNFKDGMLKEIKKIFKEFVDSEARTYGLTVDELLEQKPGSIRQFLQNYGTDLRRKVFQNYWVNKWETTLPQGNICVDDCRFLNEAEIIKKAGGIIIRIKRIGQVSNDKHASETEMLKIVPDYTIEVADNEQHLIYEEIDKIIKKELS